MPILETDVAIRPASGADLEILWRFLAIAGYEPDVETAKQVPFVAMHLVGWPGPGDFGFIAAQGGDPVGAAWARQFMPAEEPAFYVDERTPEVTIGVVPQMRARGVGERLLRALMDEAARRAIGLCLNVRHDNPARRLYERIGFRVAPGPGIPNRVGGTSFGMTWTPP